MNRPTKLPTRCPHCGAPPRLRLVGARGWADLTYQCARASCRQVYPIRVEGTATGERSES